jgi:hypothetical protein
LIVAKRVYERTLERQGEMLMKTKGSSSEDIRLCSCLAIEKLRLREGTLADHGTQLNLGLDVAFGPEPRGVEEAMRVEGG